MGEPADERAAQATQLLALYDTALPQVYGYLLDRCGNRHLAEDLTSETFLAVVRAEHRPDVGPVTMAWIVGVARHKLVDHWRRRSRDERLAARVEAPPDDDPWDAQLDQLRADGVLATLSDDHRICLTLRYLDGLPVPEVAALLDRSVHATESLLVRARAAFRRSYEKGAQDA